MSFFTLPATGTKGRRVEAAAKVAATAAALAAAEEAEAKRVAEARLAEEAAAAAPDDSAGDDAPEASEAPSTYTGEAAHFYASMRPDYDFREEEALRAPRSAPAAKEAPKRSGERRTAVFVSDLAPNARDDQLSALFRDCGVIRELYFVKDKATQRPTGCAIVTFGSIAAADLALGKDGAEIDGAAVRVVRAKPHGTGKRRADDDTEGGARFDALNNRLFPHEVEEAQVDFKKRRLAYPRDHVAS